MTATTLSIENKTTNVLSYNITIQEIPFDYTLPRNILTDLKRKKEKKRPLSPKRCVN